MKYYLITLALLLVIFIFWYFKTLKKRRNKKDLKKRILADGITDYKETTTNLVNSISKAKPLYKKLIVSIHPDKFSGDNKIIAEEISSRLTHAKRDYNALCLIEKEIENFKNIL